MLQVAIPVLLAAAGAGADPPRLGLDATVANGTGEIGVIWHLTRRFAFKPAVGFTRRTEEQTISYYRRTSGFPDSLEVKRTITRTFAGFGGDFLFYLRRGTEVDPYIVVGYSYGSQKTTYEPFQPPPGYESGFRDDPRTGHTHLATLAFGLRHALSSRVAVYGRFGFRYWASKSSSGGRVSDFDSSALGTFTSGVGVVFYLR